MIPVRVLEVTNTGQLDKLIPLEMLETGGSELAVPCSYDIWLLIIMEIQMTTKTEIT